MKMYHEYTNRNIMCVYVRVSDKTRVCEFVEHIERVSVLLVCRGVVYYYHAPSV